MNIRQQKKILKNLIAQKHSTEDIHSLVSVRSGVYREIFMKIYDEKCCYCKVPLGLISNENFQIDHFVHEESDLFEKGNRLSKTNPGDIRNIVLACSGCNSNKSNFQFSNNRMHLYPFHPDKNINKVFKINNTDYSIYISSKYSKNGEIRAFYNQLDLGNYRHQLDFLIMHLMNLENEEKRTNIKLILNYCISKLMQKRNCINLKRKNIISKYTPNKTPRPFKNKGKCEDGI